MCIFSRSRQSGTRGAILVFQWSVSYTALYCASRSVSLLKRRIQMEAESSVSPRKLPQITMPFDTWNEEFLRLYVEHGVPCGLTVRPKHLPIYSHLQVSAQKSNVAPKIQQQPEGEPFEETGVSLDLGQGRDGGRGGPGAESGVH